MVENQMNIKNKESIETDPIDFKKVGLDEHQQKLVDEKRAEYHTKHAKPNEEINAEGFPKGAQLCNKCNTKAAIVMDGCLTCLNCGESKCG